MPAEFAPGVDRARLSKSGKLQADTYQLFCESYIRHTDNEFMGTPFVLEDWQLKHFWRPLFGQGHYVRRGGERRFERKIGKIVFGLRRDGGKSDLACATLLTIATMEPVHLGEYAIIAGTKIQASKDLSKLKSMVRQSAALNALWQINKNEIVNRETDAKIMVMPYSEEALQAWHLNVCILDETHIYKDRALYNAVTSGNSQIFNSLIIMITTASKARAGFLWDVLPELRADPHAHVAWLGARDDEDIDDEEMWKRIAPMSWIGLEGMRRQRRSLTRAMFERYEINRFPLERGEDRSMRAADVNACVRNGGGFDFEQPFCLAVDGATSGDAFAIVAHQSRAGKDYFHEWVYDEPGESGYYDLNQIEGVIAWICQTHKCAVGIDPARLLLMAQQLQDDYGCEIYEIPQSNKVMCPACAMVVNASRSRSMMLGDTPKLAEHLKNCRDLAREPYGTRFTAPRHGRGTERIDAAVAAAMAKWMTQTMPQSLSFSETDGVWVV